LRAASTRRRRARLRATALPTLRLAVKPRPISAPCPAVARSPTWSTKAGVTQRRPLAATARNSRRLLRRATEASGLRPSPKLTPKRHPPASRTAACAPWHAAARALGARQRLPCGRESRAAACERCCSADRCASRRTPCQPKAKPERCIGRAGEPVKPASTSGAARRLHRPARAAPFDRR
jgi:hypothetical protein